MKKVFSTLLAVLGFSVLMAQSSADVPTGVKIAFKNAYKISTVDWTTTNEYYVAKYDENSKHKTAYYAKTTEASLVRIETDVLHTELTEATQNSMTRYTGNGSPYTLVRSFKIENFGVLTEGCELNNGQGGLVRLFFDGSGNLAKREIN